VVASPQAVYGMEMENARGIFLEETPQKMAQVCLNLLQDPELNKRQSLLAREQVEKKFGYQETYVRLAQDLLAFSASQKERRAQ
ncbi:MAG: hypothetical protein PHQ36_09555, partial [Anaerolineales bacterium]|nr:hypothetical protein [Anaerolineales bacterium]